MPRLEELPAWLALTKHHGKIAADGATTRSLDELLALPSERPLVRNFTARVMYAAVQILSGETPPVPLLDSPAT